MDVNALPSTDLDGKRPKLRTVRISRRQVGDPWAFHVVAVSPAPRAIDELVANDEVPWSDVRLQAARRDRRDDALDTQLFECPQVRSVVDRRGRDRVPGTMPGQKSDTVAGDVADGYRVARLSIWRIGLDELDLIEQFVESRAAKDSNRGRSRIAVNRSVGIVHRHALIVPLLKRT